MKVIVHRWKIIKDAGPRRKKPGTVLDWLMTDADAERHMLNNPGTIIEKIPGSGEERGPMGSTSAFRN